MDVRCERCGTEYEFDDALVSGRGTTVKCTNCGHKFKIRRSDGDFSEDFWNVRTADGRTLVFTSLRELQRAIQANQVERADMLSRGGLPPKAIGGIPELTPFFDQREGTRGGTLPPAGARDSSRSRPPPPPGASAPALAPPRQRAATRPDFPAPPAVLSSAATKTIPGTGDEVPPARVKSDMTRTQPLPVPSMRPQTLPGVAPPSEESPRISVPPPVPTRSAPPVPSRAPPVPTRSAPPVPSRAPPVPSRAPPAPAPVAAAASSPPAARPAEREAVVASEPAISNAPAAVATEPKDDRTSPLPPLRRVSFESSAEDSSERAHESRRSYAEVDMPARERRRPVGGYVVAMVVLFGVGLVGAIWARDNLGSKLGVGKPAATVADPRVAGFLSTGEQALAEGNLELAKESFDKASVVAEREPRVLLGIARLAAARADVFWLKSRLLPTDAVDEHRLVRDGLAELAQASRKSADDALALAADDPAALRAKVDALRISGDRDGARALVAKLGGSAAQPETSYVLAVLDLAEAEPGWPSVVERLRTAAAAESGPGRARAALVYALARSGDAVGAKNEVDRLAGMTRQHPLLPLLRAFAERARTATPVGSARPDAGVVEARPMTASVGGPALGGGGGGAPAGDPRQLVAQGEAARAKGEYEKARSLFAAAVEKSPSDSEALHGLAAIAHAQRDIAGAKAAYKRVLAINPSYLPSLIGLADTDWDSGDKGAALKSYKEIVDRFPPGTYPPRVQQRLDASAGAEKPAPAPAPAPAPDPGGGG